MPMIWAWLFETTAVVVHEMLIPNVLCTKMLPFWQKNVLYIFFMPHWRLLFKGIKCSLMEQILFFKSNSQFSNDTFCSGEVKCIIRFWTCKSIWENVREKSGNLNHAYLSFLLAVQIDFCISINLSRSKEY